MEKCNKNISTAEMMYLLPYLFFISNVLYIYIVIIKSIIEPDGWSHASVLILFILIFERDVTKVMVAVSCVKQEL